MSRRAASSCFRCRRRNTLRWYGGSGTCWQDVVCIACGSTYEVKTKADMEKIGKAYQYNSTRGGSFAEYHQAKRGHQPKYPNRKMFVVNLPRKATIDRLGAKVHHVYIEEIQTVLPVLSERSFRPKSDTIILKSEIVMKLPRNKMKTKWFDLPALTAPLDTMKILEDMICISHYGHNRNVNSNL